MAEIEKALERGRERAKVKAAEKVFEDAISVESEIEATTRKIAALKAKGYTPRDSSGSKERPPAGRRSSVPDASNRPPAMAISPASLSARKIETYCAVK